MLLIFETITWKPHIETAMEIAITRRDAGERVVYCNLRDKLPAMEDASPVHALIDLPSIRIGRAAELLERERIHTLEARYSPEERARAREQAAALLAGCRDVEQLKRLSIEGFSDLGWGILSSVVSITRDSTASPASHAALFRRYCETSLLVFWKAREIIGREKPDEVLLFNGRFASTRAVLRAAESLGVRWLIHERGGSRDTYQVLDFIPHDLDRLQRDMAALPESVCQEHGPTFFENRRHRVEKAWHSFTKQQQLGRLPAEMREPGEWVTFFTSSEDEMLSIGDRFHNTAFPTQRGGIEAVARAVASVPGLRLCVRVHPHVALKSAADRKLWSDLGLPGVLLIGPSDTSDSYALIDRSKVVCTYSSTIGIEATYWGRPSLLLARTFYDRLGVCRVAQSEADILDYLRNPVAYPRERTLCCGAYFDSCGTRHVHYAADGLHRGSILGVYLDDAPVMRLARALRRLVVRGRRAA
jgi:hypothetical protein